MNNIRCLLLFVLFLGGGVLIQAQDYKYGIMTMEGKVITPAIYDAVDNRALRNGETHLSVEKNGSRGIIGADGKQVGELKYDYVSIYSRPLYEVRKDGKCGFMNKKGDEVIPCIYDNYITTDDMGQWYCMSLDGKWGMVDSLNNIIFPFEFSDIECSKNNRSTYNIGLEKGDKWALADRSAEILTPFIYDRLTLFPKGGGIGYRDDDYYLLSSSGKEIAVAANEDDVEDTEYFIAVKYYDQEHNRELIFYDYSGKKINTYKGNNISFFSDEGIASISVSGESILIDTLGNVISRLKVTAPYNRESDGVNFCNGRAIATDPQEGKHGVIDIHGNVITPFIYDRLEALSHAEITHCVVKDRNFNESLLVLDKKQPGPAVYKNLSFYYPFFIKGKRIDYGYKEGLISLEGEELTEFIYDEVVSANNYLAALELDEKTGFMNVLTGAKTDIIFDGWEYPHFGKCLVVKKDRLKGVIDSDCKTILDCIYRDIEITPDGYIIATNQDHKSAIFDTEGKIVRPFGEESLYYFHNNLLIFDKETE